MKRQLGEAWDDLSESVSQEPYANRVSVSKKDLVKIAAFAVGVFAFGWVWHDVLGKSLPSPKVWDFWEHVLETLELAFAVGVGVLYARRRKP